MRYRHVNLNLLLVFHELMQSGSALRASRALGVTQGAVSQALAKLRKHFGDESFIKTNMGVSPTVVAQSLADDVRQAIAYAEAALIGGARFDPMTSNRDIKICMADMGEIRILPKMLQVFSHIAPGCRVVVLDLWGEELKQGFERGEVDLAINARAPPIGDVLQQRLFEDSYVVLTSKDNPLDDDANVQELSAARHVAVSPGRVDPAGIDDQLLASGIKRNIVAWVANWVSVPYIVQSQPHVIAIVPNHLATAFRNFAVKSVRPKIELPKIEIFQFWHRRANTDSYNMWLRAQVREMFGRAPQDAVRALNRPAARA